MEPRKVRKPNYIGGHFVVIAIINIHKSNKQNIPTLPMPLLVIEIIFSKTRGKKVSKPSCRTNSSSHIICQTSARYYANHKLGSNGKLFTSFHIQFTYIIRPSINTPHSIPKSINDNYVSMTGLEIFFFSVRFFLSILPGEKRGYVHINKFFFSLLFLCH